MGLLDDLKNTALKGVEEQVVKQAEAAAKSVTDRIPGELDDKIVADVETSIEKNLGLDEPASKSTK